ncbi:MAG: ABC transporter ATP-binding protein, partial [Chloroflexota bacterium]|nr:ABC transporter ATP-binding protein [Chloroflexota bacterium]
SGGREVVEGRPPLGEIAPGQARLAGLGLQGERAWTALLAYTPDGVELERQLASEGLQVLYRTANLEDVFLRLTGRSFEEDD